MEIPFFRCFNVHVKRNKFVLNAEHGLNLRAVPLKPVMGMGAAPHIFNRREGGLREIKITWRGV